MLWDASTIYRSAEQRKKGNSFVSVEILILSPPTYTSNTYVQSQK